MNRSANMLRWALKSNAFFSFSSGLMLFLLSHRLAESMGIPEPLVLSGIGVGLILFAFILIQTSIKRAINPTKVYTIILLDGAWVLGSLIILLFSLFALNPVAYWIIGIVAGIVGLLGFWQYLGIQKSASEI